MRAGPLNMRVTTSSRSDVRSTVVSFLAAPSPLACTIRLLLLLASLDELVQLLEPLFPDAPVAIEPFVKLLHRLRAEPVWAAVRGARRALPTQHLVDTAGGGR